MWAVLQMKHTYGHFICTNESSIIYPSKVISVSIDALESDLVVEQRPEVV